MEIGDQADLGGKMDTMEIADTADPANEADFCGLRGGGICGCVL